MEKLKERIINQAKKSLEDAVICAKQITTENNVHNKTCILNTEYHLSQFFAYMEILWELINMLKLEVKRIRIEPLRRWRLINFMKSEEMRMENINMKKFRRNYDRMQFHRIGN